MSSTVTLTRSSASLQTLLADYDLKHSTTPAQGTPRKAPGIAGVRQQAPPWDETHRRVPPYRPVERERMTAERDTTLNTGERIFITFMFTGVKAQADFSTIWRATGEKIFGKCLDFKIGGEW